MLKFTIRELLLLTLVVGLAVAWGLRELERARAWRNRIYALERASEMRGLKVEWGDRAVKLTENFMTNSWPYESPP